MATAGPTIPTVGDHHVREYLFCIYPTIFDGWTRRDGEKGIGGLAGSLAPETVSLSRSMSLHHLPGAIIHRNGELYVG
jgi:hypothetical protein